MDSFHVIIPARYQSSRLPGKPLTQIGNQSMILHVCDRAKESGAESITVATDNNAILDEVQQHGYDAVLTREDHPSGSDRIYEAAEKIGLNDEQIIVNVQGDEPFIPAENISLVASLLSSPEDQMSTLCCPISEAEEVLDPNAVKVIFDKNGKAIYFSRSPIPYDRENIIKLGSPLSASYYRHIGIYAYRKSFLKQFISWSPSELESAESLEQLRVIENGFSIKIAALEKSPPHGVDTPLDLEKAKHYFESLK
ncbi:3-deoxy-manno-octulosonate cytidylyltransferase [Aliikangiella coralliicola]|uniref:3-deoxy-manno-octulosonate cytidylyltransferase n=1 Tax=Aliikangiella coralliicola TaxID=2592383 RepID=A0A545U8P4_9GAMM|nr:3-deoxy-manno-octulosonate cytidylyltransferase [Aliikangiella coralliicola]TQV85839.1 3-deoxy-manno-octulosonate cytidylyltransferase [Aliikangiella coralliicola]